MLIPFSPPNTPYVANAVTFDGSVDYLEKNTALSGVSDTKLLTLSFWIKTSASGSFQSLMDSDTTTSMFMGVGSSDNFRLSWDESDGSPTINISGGTNLVTGNWTNVLCSFDLTNTGKRHVYVNDSDDSPTWDVYDNNNMSTGNSNWTIGEVYGGGNNYYGDIADFWLDIGTYIDFSVTANRRKFIDSNGKPVYLGSNGNNPTGSSPTIFQSGATATWHTNKGTGGGFTENRPLTTASTSPSD